MPKLITVEKVLLILLIVLKAFSQHCEPSSHDVNDLSVSDSFRKSRNVNNECALSSIHMYALDVIKLF